MKKNGTTQGIEKWYKAEEERRTKRTQRKKKKGDHCAHYTNIEGGVAKKV